MCECITKVVGKYVEKDSIVGVLYMQRETKENKREKREWKVQKFVGGVRKPKG
jgi:hypothetical protein